LRASIASIGTLSSVLVGLLQSAAEEGPPGPDERIAIPDCFPDERKRRAGAMGQLGFFDLSRRYEGLDVKDDPLVAIAAMVPWESLRPKLKASLITGGLRASDVARKSPAGRKPWDEVHQAGERRVRAIPANLASKSLVLPLFR
jgi:hypothetical protein